MTRYLPTILLALTCLGCSGAVEKADGAEASSPLDWPNWRGPNHDGISVERGWLDEWDKDEPVVAWRKNVGIGFSSVSVSGGRLYTMGHEKGKDKIGTDAVWCLDAKTGKEIWKHTYECNIVDNLHEGGPATTPTVDDGRVFTISKEGDLFALDAETGKVLWNHKLSKLLGVRMPKWGFSCSPLVLGNMLIVEASRTIALDKKTGRMIWKTDKFKPGYGSPASFQRDGRTLIAVLNNEFVMVVDAKDGEIVAKFPWTTSFDTSSTTPIIHGDTIYISTAYNKGCALFDFDGKKLTPRYANKDMRNHMANSVLYEGHLYGFDGKSHNARLVKLVCMEYDTGKVKWAERGLGCGSLKLADGKLIVLSDRGELLIAPATPKEFAPIGREKFLDGKCWTVPVLSGGLIYCRNANGDLVAVDVRKED
ncbi:MAG: PQQ-binding-like beta-propeller repeat protein [Pirellulales bacterium]|nr:PQQ-binding-like beta-propeller repeat protein [Pirellulales bacterium]